MKQELVQEAQVYLDDLYENLPDEKSGEELLNRMEFKIRQHEGETYEAIKKALGIWLRGDHEVKAEYAIDLIGRLRAVEYLPELEQIFEEMQNDSSRLPNYWRSFVKAIIDKLKQEQVNG